MFCANCGAQLEDGKKFCGDCGAMVEDDSPQTAESSVGGAAAESAQSAEIPPSASAETNEDFTAAIVAMVLLGVIGLVFAIIMNR
ncbi:MAG: hypothetical protein Pg6C_10500 [Treponemataceae bacterium]|nr:MAG: hypothetical protein Pg6C_10500 [Treponemataceae bacterium]